MTSPSLVPDQKERWELFAIAKKENIVGRADLPVWPGCEVVAISFKGEARAGHWWPSKSSPRPFSDFPGGQFAEYVDPWRTELGTKDPIEIGAATRVLFFAGMQRVLV